MDDRHSLLDNPKVRKLDSLPEGWRVMDGALTQPNGWVWANNGKSIESGKRETALVREG